MNRPSGTSGFLPRLVPYLVRVPVNSFTKRAIETAVGSRADEEACLARCALAEDPTTNKVPRT